MNYVLGMLLLVAVNCSYAAGGIYLGATRIIFDSANKTATISANNSSETDTWLLRSWVSPYVSKDESTSDSANAKKAPFVVTPPLYRLDAKGAVQLRINRTSGLLPEDRESIFYFNALGIPPKPKEAKGNMVQFALNTQIKLFYRPHALNNERAVAQASNQLTVKGNGTLITINNPTPYYLTLTNIILNDGGGFLVNEPMVAPFGSISAPSSLKHGKLSYQAINDYGGQTPVVSKTF